jgi:hypothetical protein
MGTGKVCITIDFNGNRGGILLPGKKNCLQPRKEVVSGLK